MSQAREASREVQCDGKTVYGTKRAAKDQIRRIQQRAGGKLEAYRCPWCDSWHLGHARTEWGAVSHG